MDSDDDKFQRFIRGSEAAVERHDGKKGPEEGRSKSKSAKYDRVVDEKTDVMKDIYNI